MFLEKATEVAALWCVPAKACIQMPTGGYPTRRHLLWQYLTADTDHPADTSGRYLGADAYLQIADWLQIPTCFQSTGGTAAATS